MKDESLNNKNYELRAFIRPSKKGASMDTQRKALVASGVNPDFIYEDWKEVVEYSRPGDTICLYDLFYLGTSNSMIVKRWQWIIDTGREIDLVREKDIMPEKYWTRFFYLYKRTVQGVGKDRIGKAQDKGGGRHEAWDEAKYRKAFDLWNDSIDEKLSVTEAAKICGTSRATFYVWAAKYLERLSNEEVPHAPLSKRRMNYMRDRAGIKKGKDGRYYRTKFYHK